MRISDWSSDGCSSDLAGDLCLPRSRRIPSSRPRVPRPRKTELSGRYLAARVAYALVSGARYPAPRISRGDVMLRSMFLGAALLLTAGCGKMIELANQTRTVAAPREAVFARMRSEERRVGKECVSTCRSRG